MYLADVSGYSGTWRGQSTHLQPVVLPWNKIDNSDGQLTSSQNILQDPVCYLCFCVNYTDQINDLMRCSVRFTTREMAMKRDG